MAEIRKHKPSTSAIAQALSAAMGEPIRPTAPGARPFDDDADANSPSAGEDRTASSAPVSLSEVGGSTAWRGFTVTSLPPKKSPEPVGDDEFGDDV